ncbi:MAG: DUF4394 domain-containing protein [Verrucomicrobiales bacterium]
MILSSAAKAEIIYGVTLLRELITFDSASPGTVSSTVPITGLVDQDASEAVVAIDIRPFDQQLYALGNAPGSVYRLYTINPATGLATQVGTGALEGAPNGSSFGFDFNPFADRLRVVNETDQNLRYVPNDAALAGTDTPLAFAAGDPNAGQNPSIGAAAYTNSFVGAPSTALFNIDFGLDILVTQEPPNAGSLNTVGALGVDFSSTAGFDISGVTGIAYASSAQPTALSSQLYTVNISTGQATLVGNIGNQIAVRDIAAFVPIPEPSGAMLLGLRALGCLRRRRIGR